LSGSNSTGMGIRIMRYRARVIGATLDLKSRPGQGTQVACVFYSAPQKTEDAQKKPVAKELITKRPLANAHE
jgi:two-component system, LuxR family, sensor kinase FixL